MVHVHKIAAKVAEQYRAPFALIVKLVCAGDVKVGLGVVHHRCLHIQRDLVGRLAVFHIDLSGHRLHAIDDGSDALGNLNAFKPLRRHIVQSPRSGQTAHDGAVFVKHLHIDTALAKQTYLTSSRDSIAVPHCNTGRILKALGQVAACHFAETCRSDNFCADVFAFGQEIAVPPCSKHRSVERIFTFAVDSGSIRHLSPAQDRQGKD